MNSPLENIKSAIPYFIPSQIDQIGAEEYLDDSLIKFGGVKSFDKTTEQNGVSIYTFTLNDRKILNLQNNPSAYQYTITSPTGSQVVYVDTVEGSGDFEDGDDPCKYYLFDQSAPGNDNNISKTIDVCPDK